MEFVVETHLSTGHAIETPRKQQDRTDAEEPASAIDDAMSQLSLGDAAVSATACTPVATRTSPATLVTPPPSAMNLQCSCEGDVCSVCLSPLKASDKISNEEKSVLETKCKVSATTI